MKLLAQSTATLSLAIKLRDEFAPDAPPLGTVSASLNDSTIKAFVKRATGEHLFIGLPAGKYTVRFHSTYYLEEACEVILPLPNARSPVLAVMLKPHRLYPFPSGTTLILGTVEDPDGHPVPGMHVRLTERAVGTRTGSDGKFVLYLKALTEDEVTTVVGRRLVKGNGGGHALPISLNLPNYEPKTVTVKDVEEAKTTLVSTPIVVQPM